MAFDADAVAAHLRTSADKIVALPDWVAAVTAYASKRYTTPTEGDAAGHTADDVTEFERALVMQTARLIKRQQSPSGGPELVGDGQAVVVVHRFDNDVRDMLSAYLKTAGMFGRAVSS